MSKYHAHKIIHYDLKKPLDTLPSFEPEYYVFWYEQIPLGHIWIEKHYPSSLAEWHQWVVNAIAKAVYSYFWIEQDSDYTNILYAFSGDRALIEQKAKPNFARLLQPVATTGEPVSVVICTRNRPKAIGACLTSLYQSYDQNFEIVVVDNAPSDKETAKLIAKHFPQVKYILEPRKGLDIARNTGALAASHNIVAYTDDDVIIEQDWISKVRRCFDDPMTMAVTGLVIPYELRTEAQGIFERYWGFNKGYSPLTFDHQYFLARVDEGVPAWDVGAGANMAFRKDVFSLVGLFDERLDVGASGCSGDSEFWYRVMAEGWNCNYFPNLYVYHQHRESTEDLEKQIQAYMKGNVSSIMVQYEKYGYAGDLKRVKETLPAYYKQRVKKFFRRPWSAEFRYVFTEIEGCWAGWQYYKKHKNTPAYPALPEPPRLSFAPLSEMPLVSVVIPCYNQADYLEQALLSVYSQSYQNYEIIVINDGSDDHTAAVCQKYPAVKYVYAHRVGLPNARNIGVAHAKGETIVFLDADDVLYPNALELNLYYLKTFPEMAFVYGGHDKIDATGEIIESPVTEPKQYNIYTALLQGNCIAMVASVMYRRALFFRYFFDNKLPVCEDYDLYLRIARTYDALGHAKPITGYRMHANNMSKNKTLMLEKALEILKKQEAGLQNESEKAAYQQGVQNWKAYYQS